MRGNPLIRLVIAIVVFLLLGIPVWKLTRTNHVPANAPAFAPDSATKSVTLHLSLDFEEPPQVVSLELPTTTPPLTKTLSPLGGERTIDWDVVLPKAGSDFIIQATWPTDAKRHALGVRLTAAGYATTEKTFWCDGALKDVVTLAPQN